MKDRRNAEERHWNEREGLRSLSLFSFSEENLCTQALLPSRPWQTLMSPLAENNKMTTVLPMQVSLLGHCFHPAMAPPSS